MVGVSLSEAGTKLAEYIQEERHKKGITCKPSVDFEETPERFQNHPGQLKAWNSFKRIVAAFAGWQSGKTTIVPPWLLREIQRRGPGDYALVAPNYPLLRKKSLPELKKFLRSKLKEGTDWVHKIADQEIHILPAGQMKIWGRLGDCVIFLVHADNVDAVEAFTAKAMAVDEPGQIEDEVWEGLEARVAVEQGRILLTGRPVEHNWYVKEIWNKRESDEQLEVVNFRSIDNPAFPKEEYDRQRLKLPPWKFKMKYDGIPTRPAGQIYDCFEPLYEDLEGNPLPPKVFRFAYGNVTHLGKHVCKPFEFPEGFRYFAGHDFGPVNMAAIFGAQDPDTGILYIYATYKRGGQSIENHVKGFLQQARLRTPPKAWGGQAGETDWRDDFGRHGYRIECPPIVGPGSVALGIERLYDLMMRGLVVVFDTLTNLIDDFTLYSYELDVNGDPNPKKIKDKETWHRMDCGRYLGSAIYEGLGEPIPDEPIRRFEKKEEPKLPFTTHEERMKAAYGR